jgi:hypothetical protein
MRLLRMRNGDGIYRGGKLLGNRLVVSELFERSEKSDRASCRVERGTREGLSLSEARRGSGDTPGMENDEQED